MANFTTIQIRTRQKMSPSDARVLAEYTKKHPEIATGVLISKNIQDETKEILQSAGIDFAAGVGANEETIETARMVLNATLSDRIHKAEKTELETTEEESSDVDFTSECEYSEKKEQKDVKGYKGLSENMIGVPVKGKLPKIRPAIHQDFDGDSTETDDMISGYVSECTDEFYDEETGEIYETNDGESADGINEPENAETLIQDVVTAAFPHIGYRVEVRFIPRRIRKDLAERLIQEVNSDKDLLLGIGTYAGISNKAKRLLKNCDRIIFVSSDPSHSIFEVREMLYKKLQKLRDELSPQTTKLDDALFDILYNSIDMDLERMKDDFVCKDFGFDMLKASLHTLTKVLIKSHLRLLHQVCEQSKSTIERYFNLDFNLDDVPVSDITFTIEGLGYEMPKDYREVEIKMNMYVVINGRGSFMITRKLKTTM